MTEWSGESWQSYTYVLKFNKPTFNFASHFFTYIRLAETSLATKNYQPQILLEHLDSLLSFLQKNHYKKFKLREVTCKDLPPNVAHHSCYIHVLKYI